MDRRQFLKFTAGTATASLSRLACRREPRSGTPPAGAPNLLFLVIDDLNDWVGCLGGHPDARTPNLDRLAERGVLFTNAHAASPVCNGSRVSVLTGIRPSSSGVYGNIHPMRAALPETVTLPQLFLRQGYSVAGAGKIFHDRFPDPRSWEEYFPVWPQLVPSWLHFLFLGLLDVPDHEPEGRPLSGLDLEGSLDWGALDVADEELADGKVARWAEEWLASPRERPFFLGVGFSRPHTPWYVPRRYFDLYSDVRLPETAAGDLDDLPTWARRLTERWSDHSQIVAAGKWQEAVTAYLACTSFVDAQVGRVLDALDASPHASNTHIVLWSDQGWHLGEKERWRKGTLWEESTRTPLLFAARGTARQGGRCRRAVSLLDVYPTVVELFGLPRSSALEGESLVPWLRDPTGPREAPAVTTAFRGAHSVRSDRWRYIHYPDGSEELYDHDVDDGEWTNVASSPSLAAVKQDLARWLPATSAPEAPVELRIRIKRILGI